MGGAGCISVTANLAPALCAASQTDATEHDATDSLDLQDSLSPLHEALFAEINPVPVKAALGLLGLCDPAVRLPLLHASAGVVARLDQILSAVMPLENTMARALAAQPAWFPAPPAAGLPPPCRADAGRPASGRRHVRFTLCSTPGAQDQQFIARDAFTMLIEQLGIPAYFAVFGAARRVFCSTVNRTPMEPPGETGFRKRAYSILRRIASVQGLAKMPMHRLVPRGSMPWRRNSSSSASM